MLPLPPGVVQVGEDPWTRMRQEKRERVKKNAQQQTANVKAAAKATGGQLPGTLKLAAKLHSKGGGKNTKRKELVEEVSALVMCGFV